MMQVMKQSSPMKQPVDLMSFYIPHIDADITFETIVKVLEDQMELGNVDRIEAVPKVNQKDGHKYHTCFVYLRKWGNGYNAQFLRNQILEGKETKLYYMKQKFWKIFANTSVVAKLPMPHNYSLELYIPSYYTEPISFDSIKTLFDTLELGCVSGIRNTCIGCLVVDFQYWYHSVNANLFQADLESGSEVVLEPVFSEEYPDMYWSVKKAANINTDSVNPYIYYNML
jgi:hypothetical protein